MEELRGVTLFLQVDYATRSLPTSQRYSLYRFYYKPCYAEQFSRLIRPEGSHIEPLYNTSFSIGFL